MVATDAWGTYRKYDATRRAPPLAAPPQRLGRIDARRKYFKGQRVVVRARAADGGIGSGGLGYGFDRGTIHGIPDEQLELAHWGWQLSRDGAAAGEVLGIEAVYAGAVAVAPEEGEPDEAKKKDEGSVQGTEGQSRRRARRRGSRAGATARRAAARRAAAAAAARRRQAAGAAATDEPPHRRPPRRRRRRWRRPPPSRRRPSPLPSRRSSTEGARWTTCQSHSYRRRRAAARRRPAGGAGRPCRRPPMLWWSSPRPPRPHRARRRTAAAAAAAAPPPPPPPPPSITRVRARRWGARPRRAAVADDDALASAEPRGTP